MNWSLCLICQKATLEVLKCPLNSPVLMDASPYDSFLKRSGIFRKLNRLPVPLDHVKDDITVRDLTQNRLGTSHVIQNLTKIN